MSTSPASNINPRRTPQLTTTTIFNDPILGSMIPPSSPSSHTGAARARAMSHTSEWQPEREGHQSWSAQEYLHDFHRKLAEEHDHAAPSGQQGFTERG
ncbi:hypothetical protein QBC42DRAFT_293858 [Cladorrhinum samala]|uniref:Uncharacterized protein n=1 Tax=Cladorrhinum samala TaxID=585594 RepID=A0AAV9HZL4_9PEZI|nr:hypothetical protein QBC42DRAFT_293858 [Cladorrhinum samala]